MTSDSPEVEIQTGTTSVAPEDIDAAGEDNPLGSDAFELSGDIQVLIRDYADSQYSSWEETLREYLANAETACKRVIQRLENGERVIATDGYQPIIDVEWNEKEQQLIIQDNGIGMSSYEFENGFAHVGASTSRDEGGRLGAFGVGSLSFVQVTGVDDNILVKSHSRITDENYSAYYSLGGVDPLIGSLPDDQYGTVFEMSASEKFDIRSAIETYAEWMTIPVRYTEYDENGEHVFDEDYNEKRLTDALSDSAAYITDERDGMYRAVASPECTGRTLLLSMPIDRNDSGGKRKSSFEFDVRILDETGRVVEGPNEGLIPTNRREYMEMLREAREPYIPVSECDSHDAVEPSDAEPVEVIDAAEDVLVGEEIIAGPNEGAVIMSDGEWDELDAGRAEQYIPEDQLTDDDITLPVPTSDRGRLQENDAFWEYVSESLQSDFYSVVEQIVQQAENYDDPVQAIDEMDIEDFL